VIAAPVEPRLPAQLEVQALLRQVQAAGGFATILAKGEVDAGTILVTICENGINSRLYERMPGLDGRRLWHCVKTEDSENRQEFQDYIASRRRQDGDLWIVELDIANGERFIGLA
jgi:hypothetical protein